MYGAQTRQQRKWLLPQFENDVEMYGAQTVCWSAEEAMEFENDVEMYGAQTGFILLV